jgi:hypothetical protein
MPYPLMMTTRNTSQHFTFSFLCFTFSPTYLLKLKRTKPCGLSPQANYTDRLSDRRLSAKLVPTLADRGCRVVSATTWDCKLYEDQKATMMDILSEDSKKEYPKSVTELLRLEEKRFLQGICYFMNNVPIFI